MHRHDVLTGAGALSSPEASSYFSPPNPHNVGSNHYLEIVRGAKAAVKIPIIASVNAVSKDSWVEYASQLQEAGADALQLNIYLLPTDISLSGRDIEDRYLNIVRVVKTRVTIPVAVKAGPYFSSPGHMAGELAVAGADGLVLFNLFYQPDIDVVRLKITHDLDLSRSADMRLPLLWIAVLHGRIKASLAAHWRAHNRGCGEISPGRRGRGDDDIGASGTCVLTCANSTMGWGTGWKSGIWKGFRAFAGYYPKAKSAIPRSTSVQIIEILQGCQVGVH